MKRAKKKRHLELMIKISTSTEDFLVFFRKAKTDNNQGLPLLWFFEQVPYKYLPLNLMRYKQILMIDDDDDDHEIMKSALGIVSDEVQCTGYTDARVALAHLTNNLLNPDLIFLDLNMPLMSGKEFLKEIKNVNTLSHIPVIIFSTTSQPETINLTKEMGAAGFITKPDRFDKLVDILKPIIN